MEGLEKLLVALVLYAHNFRMLHWRVGGSDFDCAHGVMGEYYDKLSDYIDDVAELCIEKELNVFSLNEILEKLEAEDEDFLEVSSGENYTSTECFEMTSTMFNSLIDIFSNLEPETVTRLQGIIDWLNKECSYKNKRRLM